MIATEVADEALLPGLGDGVGLEPFGEVEEVVELLGRVAVDGPLVVVVLVPMYVAVGGFVLGGLLLESEGGMELLPERLHSGLPVESREHVYPGAGSEKEVSKTDQIDAQRAGAYGSKRSLQGRQHNQGSRIER